MVDPDRSTPRTRGGSADDVPAEIPTQRPVAPVCAAAPTGPPAGATMIPSPTIQRPTRPAGPAGATPNRLALAIVQVEDAAGLIERLVDSGFGATRIDAAGG